MKPIQDLIYHSEGTVSNFGGNHDLSKREFVKRLVTDTLRYAIESGTLETIEGDFQTTFHFKVLICTEKEFMEHVYEMAQRIVERNSYGGPNPMIITTKEQK